MQFRELINSLRQKSLKAQR